MFLGNKLTKKGVRVGITPSSVWVFEANGSEISSYKYHNFFCTLENKRAVTSTSSMEIYDERVSPRAISSRSNNHRYEC